MNTQVETQTETSKRAVAKHALLDSAGQVVDDYEDATGIRYQDLETGKTFDYQLLGNTDATRMFALFGARTLATNEASAVRNGKEAGGGVEQIAAIEGRFALIHGTGGNGGQWVDRTREGGPRIDQQVLADCVLAVLEASGKKDPAQHDANRVALLAAWAADPKKVTMAHSVPAVRDEYAKRTNKTTRTVDDLAAMLG